MPAGYSGTPLAKKLGLKEGDLVSVLSAPAGFRKLVEPLPERVRFVAKFDPAARVVHLFATRKAELAKTLALCRKSLEPDAVIWVSWPKKAAKLDTDITEDVIRAVALPMGLVDIKVCAVDETWSGLKLMLRKELR